MPGRQSPTKCTVQTGQLELVYGQTRNKYNERATSYKAKSNKHYKTVIKQEGFYSWECSVLNEKGELQELEKIETIILGKQKTTDEKERKNEELYKYTDRMVDANIETL